jgi:hypothetical protein
MTVPPLLQNASTRRFDGSDDVSHGQLLNVYGTMEAFLQMPSKQDMHLPSSNGKDALVVMTTGDL